MAEDNEKRISIPLTEEVLVEFGIPSSPTKVFKISLLTRHGHLAKRGLLLEMDGGIVLTHMPSEHASVITDIGQHIVLGDDKGTPSAFKLIRPESTILAATKDDMIKETDTEAGDKCHICFEDLDADADLAPVYCTHKFHRGCILDWKSSGAGEPSKCPICLKRFPPINFFLPTGWKSGQSAFSGRRYFYHAKSGYHTWYLPKHPGMMGIMFDNKKSLATRLMRCIAVLAAFIWISSQTLFVYFSVCFITYAVLDILRRGDVDENPPSTF